MAAADINPFAGESERKPGDSDAHALACCALEVMTDQSRLAVLAKDEKFFFLRSNIVGRLTDQRLLAEFARNPNEQQPVRCTAVRNLTDELALAAVAKNDDDPHVRKLALSKIASGPQAALADIAKTAENGDAAFAVVEKITDQGLLAEIAVASKHGQVRSGALERIKDSQALDGLARHVGASPDTRLLAVWRLADKLLLSALAQNAPDERVRRAAAGKLSTNAQGAVERGKFADLINEGKLLAEINGDSIRNLRITLRKLAPHPLEVTIPTGTYFVCDNPAAQNMVSTTDVTLVLRGDTQSTGVPVACANKPKDIPGERDAFTLGTLPNAGELEKLMAVLGRKAVSYHTKQAAVWIVTHNADYSDLGSLRTVSQYTPRIPGVAYGTRSIAEPEAAEAMRLCDEAGIDIKTKSIWSDREKILAGLKTGELKNWLKRITGLAAPAHKKEVTKLVIGSGGNLLASSDNAGQIKLWSLPDGAFVKMLEHESSMEVLALSPDGKWLVSGGLNDDMRLWSLPAGRVVKSEGRKEHESVMAAAFSPDGKWFVTGDNYGGIKHWSLPDGKLIKTLESE